MDFYEIQGEYSLYFTLPDCEKKKWGPTDIFALVRSFVSLVQNSKIQSGNLSTELAYLTSFFYTKRNPNETNFFAHMPQMYVKGKRKKNWDFLTFFYLPVTTFDGGTKMGHQKTHKIGPFLGFFWLIFFHVTNCGSSIFPHGLV